MTEKKESKKNLNQSVLCQWNAVLGFVVLYNRLGKQLLLTHQRPGTSHKGKECSTGEVQGSVSSSLLTLPAQGK